MVDEQSALAALLDAGLHRCAAVFAEDGGLLASLFMTGLIGSASHCAGMCGPFVLSQTAARLEARPVAGMREWHRLSGAALLPYHIGRATTYAGLGAAGALLTGILAGAVGLRWLSAALLGVAALFMLGLAFPGLERLLGPRTGGGEGWWGRGVGAVARPLFAAPTGLRGWLLGVFLGFIPCGLLYAALAAAASSGDAATAAFAMIAFWLGTVPGLFAVGLIGHVAARHWRTALLRFAPLLLVLNAGVLTWMAWRLVIA